jgi:ElaB/YqjD/DUF883 family membrane-anchored ribosome-binding protein
MTEPLRKYSSSDIPEYSSYPAEPDRSGVEVIETTVISEFEAMPEAGSNRYDEQGRKIGAALGRLANKINGITVDVRKRASQELERAEDEVALAKEAVERSYEDLAYRFRRSARRAVCDARAKAGELRVMAAETVDEYPMETLAAAGVAGILVGVGLRAWRENRG